MYSVTELRDCMSLPFQVFQAFQNCLVPRILLCVRTELKRFQPRRPRQMSVCVCVCVCVLCSQCNPHSSPPIAYSVSYKWHHPAGWLFAWFNNSLYSGEDSFVDSWNCNYSTTWTRQLNNGTDSVHINQQMLFSGRLSNVEWLYIEQEYHTAPVYRIIWFLEVRERPYIPVNSKFYFTYISSKNTPRGFSPA